MTKHEWTAAKLTTGQTFNHNTIVAVETMALAFLMQPKRAIVAIAMVVNFAGVPFTATQITREELSKKISVK